MRTACHTLFSSFASAPAFQSPSKTFLLLVFVALSGCSDRGQEPTPDATATPPAPRYDQSLLRWKAYPETDHRNGPWSLDQRAGFYRVPGVAIYAWNGTDVVERAFGISGPDQSQMTTSTVVRVGPRLSTGVASLVVMAQLSASSRDLNKSLADELSATPLPKALRAVTLAELLAHSAGIGPAQIPADTRSLDGLLANEAFRRFTPGADTAFSETGYAIIQRFFEEVTVRPWDRLAYQRLFAPLGLDHTRYQEPPPNASLATYHNASGRPISVAPPVASAANGLFTSAHDLGTLLQTVQPTLARHLTDGPWTVRQARFAVEPRFGNWGMGWESWSPKAYGIEGESGKAVVAMGPGEHNLAVFFLDRSAGAVVLTNGARGGTLAREVLLGLAQQFGWESFQTIQAFPQPPAEGLVRALVGKWDYRSKTIEIRWQDEQLTLEGFSEQPTPMLSDGGNRWILLDAPQQISFDTSKPDRIRIDGTLALRRDTPADEPTIFSH